MIQHQPGAALDGLGLIQYHVLPMYALEILDILDDQLVTRDDHMERGFLGVQVPLVPELTQHFAILCIAPIWDNLKDNIEELTSVECSNFEYRVNTDLSNSALLK